MRGIGLVYFWTNDNDRPHLNFEPSREGNRTDVGARGTIGSHWREMSKRPVKLNRRDQLRSRASRLG